MSNLIKNPSFEEGLNFWYAHNVYICDFHPFEGTAAAQLGPGIANISQDFPLGPARGASLQLSFGIASPSMADPGNLTVNISWLDNHNREIGTGLSMLIPSGTTAGQKVWVTRVNTTGIIPDNVFKARINFAKSEGCGDKNIIEIDLVVISKVDIAMPEYC